MLQHVPLAGSICWLHKASGDAQASAAGRSLHMLSLTIFRHDCYASNINGASWQLPLQSAYNNLASSHTCYLVCDTAGAVAALKLHCLPSCSCNSTAGSCSPGLPHKSSSHDTAWLPAVIAVAEVRIVHSLPRLCSPCMLGIESQRTKGRLTPLVAKVTPVGLLMWSTRLSMGPCMAVAGLEHSKEPPLLCSLPAAGRVYEQPMSTPC